MALGVILRNPEESSVSTVNKNLYLNPLESLAFEFVRRLPAISVISAKPRKIANEVREMSHNH